MTMHLRLVLLALGALAAACDGEALDQQLDGGRTGPRACRANVDCAGDGACIDGLCQKECERDTDCPDPSYMCWGFRCIHQAGGEDGSVGRRDVQEAPDVPTVRCGTYTDCPGPNPQACVEGVCVAPECYAPDECAGGEWCCYYACVPGGDATACTAPRPDVVVARDVVEPPDVPTPRDVPVPPRDVPTPPPDVPVPVDVPPDAPGPQPYGAECEVGSDCDGGYCLLNKSRGGKTCTKECGSTRDCPAPDFCAGTSATFPLPGWEAAGYPDVCIPSDAGLDCLGGCVSGISFGDSTNGPCECSAPCPSAASCPADMACDEAQVGSDVMRVCVRIGQTCAPCRETACTPAQLRSTCYAPLCYPTNDDATEGRCTISCTAEDECPRGWTCFAEEIEGQTVRTCQPEGAR